MSDDLGDDCGGCPCNSDDPDNGDDDAPKDGPSTNPSSPYYNPAYNSDYQANDPTSNGQTCSAGVSGHPVRYSSGQLHFVENDLRAQGFSIPWGHTRSYANVLSNNSTGINGNSWLVHQFKALAVVAPSARQTGGASGASAVAGSICIVDSANASRWFTPFSGGIAQSLFSGFDSLVQDIAAGEVIWQRVAGVLSTPGTFSLVLLCYFF